MSYRLKIKEAFEKTQNIDEQETPAQQAASFDNKKSYYQQPENQVNILKPLVRAWRTNPDIQIMKNRGIQINDLSKIYIEKFEEANPDSRVLDNLVTQTIEAVKAEKGTQAKPEAKQEPAPAASEKPVQAPVEPVAPPATVQVQEPAKKEVSEFFQKLNALKKALKLTKSHVDAIKALNTRFMRASHQLSEAKNNNEQKPKKQSFGQTYIKEKIAEVVGTFADFDEVEKANLIKALNKMFLSLYIKPRPAATQSSSSTQQATPSEREAASASTVSVAPQPSTQTDKPSSYKSGLQRSRGTQVAEEDIAEMPFQEIYDESSKSLENSEKKLADAALDKIKTHVNVNDIDPKTGRYTGSKLEPQVVSKSIKDVGKEIATIAKQAVDDTVLGKVTSVITTALQKAGIIDQQAVEEILNEIKKSNKNVIYEGMFDKFATNKQPNNSKQLFTFDGNKFKKYNRG